MNGLQDSEGPAPRAPLVSLQRLFAVLRMEQSLLRLLLIYAGGVALLSLIIPLTMQELINTFSYAIQPVMVVTLSTIMAGILLLVGSGKVLQYCAVEMLERRLFARIALGMAHGLPQVSLDALRPKDANVFVETVFLQRAASTLLMDLVNIGVGSLVGMGILIFYHPYFLLFDMILFGGCLLVGVGLASGGLPATVEMSHAKYAVLNWIQEVANNHLFFKVSGSQTLAIMRTDALIQAYLGTRGKRFRVLIRQYAASAAWQAMIHGALLGMAGWLITVDQLTIGQLVGAEVIVGGLLVNYDSVIKQTSHVFYLLTALTELDEFFSLRRDELGTRHSLSTGPTGGQKIHLSCRDLVCVDAKGTPAFDPISLDVAPGERVAILAESTEARSALVQGLVGLRDAAAGVVRYNGIDLRDLDQSTLYHRIGVVFDYQPTLIEGTLEDNIVMGRSVVTYEDVQRALKLVDLEDEINAFPLGLRTSVERRGKAFSIRLVTQVMVARAVVTRPSVLLLEGGLPGLDGLLRESILRRLVSKDTPWSVILIVCDPHLALYAERRLVLRSPSP